MLVEAAIVLVMVVLVAVVVIDVSTAVVQTIMLFVAVIGRSIHVCLLSHSIIGRGLS